MGGQAPARRLRALGALVLKAAAVRACLALALALAGLACAPVVRSQNLPGLAEQKAPLTRVAVVPFTPSIRLTSRTAELGDATPAVVASMVTRHLSETLAERVSVVPPEEVGLALGLEGTPTGRLSPAEVARRAAEEFGADAVVLGEVTRFVERAGQAAGTMRPASVGFLVTLYAAPGARPLWRARFDETQRSLNENIFNAGRYPGGGTRWLSGEELARWGAGEVALALPLGP